MSEESEIEAATPLERLATITCTPCGTVIDVSKLEPFEGVQCPKCGNQDTVPARFGEFLLLNLINTGGMGQVYRGRDESLGRLVAIKVMLRKLGEDTEFVENFRREAQAAARLNHPHIAQIYSYGQVSGQPYIVMELVSGHRFDKLIDSHPDGLDPAMVLRIGLEIAEGLQAADEIGLIHGDIKPENILLDEKRQAKLVDFGIASYADQAASAGIWGTPYYIAPEKVRGRKSDVRSDIYSLGATLYHALAGKPPFEGETPIDVVKARLTSDPVPLETVRPDLPKGVSKTVARMLQREPPQRHPTYASLVGDLRRSLQEVQAAGGPSTRVTTTGKRMIIKKKEGPGFSGTGRQGVPPVGGKPLPDVEKLRELEATRRRKSRWTFVVVFGLMALAGGSFVLITNRNEQRQKELGIRRQAYELKQAVDRTKAIDAAIQAAAANAQASIARFDPIAARARAVVTNLDALVAAMPAAAVPEPVAVPPPGPAVAPPPAVGVDEAGREAPFGMPNNKPKPGPAQAAATDAATVAVVVPPLAPASVSPTTQAHELADQVARIALTAHAEGTNIVSMLQAVDRLREAAGQASSTNAVNEQAVEMEAHQARLAAVAADLKAGLQQAETLTVQVEKLGRDARVALDRQRTEALRAQEAQGREAALVAERAGVAERERSGDELARGGQYAEALKDARRGLAAAKSEEARTSLQRLVDRYERLDRLRGSMIEALNQEPFAWGWGRSGVTGEDVLGANAKGVKLRGREVAWGVVSKPQYLKFVDHYTASPKARRSIQGEQYLAAAIFCEINDNPDLARVYRDKAVSTLPSLEAEAKRLLAID